MTYRVTIFIFILTLFFVTPTFGGSDIVICDASGLSIGRINGDGRVDDSSGLTVGRICEDGRVDGGSGMTIGYVRSGRVDDASGMTMGYVRDDGRIDGSSGLTIGYIREGRVEYSSTLCALTYSGPMDLEKIAAYLFFFNRILFE